MAGYESFPDGWPGRLWIDGRTPVQVGDFVGQAEEGKGPKSKSEIPVFHNPAMTGSRTRSVLLLDQCLKENWVTKPDSILRVLDGLAASAVRSRRWLTEIRSPEVERLRVTAIDSDDVALSWASANHNSHPPLIGNCEDIDFPEHIMGLRLICGDLRAHVLESGWQWIDLDPFGPPTPFIDTVMQGLSRRAVIEITATDTAALCGAAIDSARRRYGTMGVVDDLRHDTAMRVLLGHVASVAARHDRTIKPLISIFDDHHVRVSVLSKKSKEEASSFAENIGWRIHSPTNDEILKSMNLGLHPLTTSNEKQLSVLLPWDEGPSELTEKRVSGPLWIGPLGSKEVYANMTEERAISLCSLNLESDKEIIAELGLSESGVKDTQRFAKKAVRGLEQVSDVIDIPFTYPVDMIASILSDISGPPSPSKLATKLNDKGWRAAKDFLPVPAVRTDAPWDVIIETVREISPATNQT